MAGLVTIQPRLYPNGQFEVGLSDVASWLIMLSQEPQLFFS